MKTYTVNRAELLAQLEFLGPGLTNKDFIQQSSCVVFRKGYAVSYCGEVMCRAKTTMPKELVAVVPGGRLTELLRKLEGAEEIEKGSGGKVKLSFNQETVELACGGKAARLRYWQEVALPYQDVPVPEAEAWQDLPEEFAEAVAMVAEWAVKKDDDRFLRTVVHLTPKYVEATDGFRMCRHKVKLPLSGEFLLRRQHAEAVAKCGPTAVCESLTENAGWLHFKSGSRGRLTVAAFQDKYLDLSKQIAFEGTPTSLPKGLAAAADWAETFSAEFSDDNKLLVQLGAEKNRLKVIGEGLTGEASETFQVEFRGEPMEFRVTPKLLRSISEKYDQAVVGTTQLPNGEPLRKLRVDGGRWVFVTVLGKPQKEEKRVSEEVGGGGDDAGEANDEGSDD